MLKTLSLLSLTLLAAGMSSCSTTQTAEPMVADASAPQDAGEGMEDQMQAMMAAAAKYTQPGPEHDFLGMLIGDWDVTAQVTMGPGLPKSDGTATVAWKIENRFIESTWSGDLMGMPGTNIQVLGYDRLKQSFVWSSCGTYDTALNRAEGDLTQDGRTLILYGTLDEYLTGEHDKMVKYVFRFRGESGEDGELSSVNGMTLEVHDLPIGEENTKVMEFVYSRRD